MLPVSLNAAGHTLLNAPRATQAVPTARSANIIALLLAAARRALHALSMWQQRAAGRHALDGLDDHILRDIGLTRADVERQLVKPFWRN